MSAPKLKSAAFRTMYMHTLDGQPASYEPGYQIHYTTARSYVRLFDSLAEIRANEHATIAYRRKRSFGLSYATFGYRRVRVRVPELASSRTGGQRT